MDQSMEGGPQRSGSVKRAREKAAAEERIRREAYEKEYQSQPPPLHVRRQRPENLETRRREQMPSANAMSRGQPGYGPRTAMITPQPQKQQQQHQANQQWPLPQAAQLQMHEQRRQQQQQHQFQPHMGRQQAPGRPMMNQQQVHPSMRQAPFVQEQSGQIINGHHGSQSREAESYLDASSSMSNMSNMATPGTDISGTSRESEASSTGTIPEFPAPMPATMKPSGLGPPPSARRGPPGLYSGNLAVTPITEETARVQAFDPTTSYLADKTPEESGRREQSPTFFDAGMSDDDDAHIEQGIVRSASMGRRRKPTMVSHQNRNSDKTQEGGVLGKTRALMGAGLIAGAGANSPVASKSQLAQAIQAGQQKEQPPPIPTIVHPAYRGKEKPQWPTFGGEDSPIENKELDLMSSDSGSTLATPTPGEHEMKKLAPVAVAAGARHLTPSPGAQSFRNSGLGPGKEKDGLTALGEIQYNRHSAIRRPPKLNLNAVRDAEARGSLTSLPDLIRRATKLASMMNEGKRPASRLNNLNDFPMEHSEKGSLGSYHSPSFPLLAVLEANLLPSTEYTSLRSQRHACRLPPTRSKRHTSRDTSGRSLAGIRLKHQRSSHTTWRRTPKTEAEMLRNAALVLRPLSHNPPLHHSSSRRRAPQTHSPQIQRPQSARRRRNGHRNLSTRRRVFEWRDERAG